MIDIFTPLLAFLSLLTAIIALSGVILLVRSSKKKSDTAQKILIGLFSAIGVFCLLKIAETILVPQNNLYDEVMVLPYMLLFLFFQCLNFLYPMEVLKPGWFCLKRLICIFAPFLFILVLYYLLDFDYVKLYCAEDLVRNIKKPDVIFRIAALALMIPYSIALPLLQFQNKRVDVTNLGLFVYILGIVANTFFLTITLVSGMTQYYIVYSINSICLSIYLLYFELRIRQTATLLIPSLTPTQLAEQEKTEKEEQKTVKQSADDKLYDYILYQLEEKELWKYPNLDIQGLAHEAGTNKTYILNCLKERRGCNYVDYINHKRIEYVVNSLKENPKQNLQELFTSAGYSSRTTAWRNFKAITGMTPTEFIKTL